MSSIVKGILSMPSELFWSDEALAREQHEVARKEVVNLIIALEAEIERLENLVNMQNYTIEKMRAVPKSFTCTNIKSEHES